MAGTATRSAQALPSADAVRALTTLKRNAIRQQNTADGAIEQVKAGKGIFHGLAVVTQSAGGGRPRLFRLCCCLGCDHRKHDMGRVNLGCEEFHCNQWSGLTDIQVNY